MTRLPKTPEQLQHEIAYYARQLTRTTSADRIQRALVAIRVRERQLLEARRVRAARGEISQTSEKGSQP